MAYDPRDGGRSIPDPPASSSLDPSVATDDNDDASTPRHAAAAFGALDGTFTSPPFRDRRGEPFALREPAGAPAPGGSHVEYWRFADTGPRSPRRSVDGSDPTNALGVRVPKRPRPPPAPDDDVQPTRAFGASPGTKRALSELMASNLLRLNVSPMDTASSPAAGGLNSPVADALAVTPPSGAADAFAAAHPFGRADAEEARGSGGAEERLAEEDRAGKAAALDDASPFEPTPMMSEDAVAVSPESPARAGAGQGTIIDRRRKSILSEQLSGIAPMTQPLPSPSRLLGALGIAGDGGAAVVTPSSPSAEPSPRADLRRQAILGSAKRASLLMPGGFPRGDGGGYVISLAGVDPTSPPPPPKLFLPAPIAEEHSDDDDEDARM